jgi:hypothetical protein
MQVSVGGMPANEVFSTVVWQYRQSIPSPATWCSWLKGTGCSRTTDCPVTYGDLKISATTNSPPVRRKRMPKMVTLERVLVLR